jgi:hypothetical protein
MLHQISEETIKKLAEEMKAYYPSSTYIYVLEIGQKYKDHDLTPMYLYDPKEGQIYVTSEERAKKKFH